MPRQACMSSILTFAAMLYLTMGPHWNFSKVSSTDGLTSGLCTATEARVTKLITEARVTKLILRTAEHVKFLSVDKRLRTS